MLSEPIQTFMYSLKSKETQKQYSIYIEYFEKYYGNKKIETLLELDSKTIEKTLIDYIIFMREQGLSSAYLKGRIYSIISFLELNDVLINKKKINRFYPEDSKTVRDEAYTHEDLLKMFEQATFRTKLIISIYSSTGIRKTALVDIKLKHLEKIDNFNLYKFVIYENSKEQYITFCTPECATYIDNYIEQRKKAGEKITQESYLIRNDFNFSLKNRARLPKQTTSDSLTQLMTDLLERMEFHEINHKTEDYKYQRHAKAGFHAFRKYFNTCLANCGVNLLDKRLLMGWKSGLEDSYYRPDEKQLLSEYSKAINELTIEESNRLRKQVTELEQKQSEIDKMKYEHSLEMKQIRDEMEKLGMRLNNIGLVGKKLHG